MTLLYDPARSMCRSAAAMGLVLALVLASAAYGTECRDDPDMVGKCFKVHGRFHGTAGGLIELTPVGRDPLRGRILRVHFDPWPGRAEPIWMPEVLQRIESDEDFYGPHRPDVYGDFEVCRLEADIAGHMRAICIQSVEHLVVRRGPR